MTTYYARVDYSYSGDSKFTIPFSYIKKEHIVVLVNGVKTTNYTYITSSQIEVKDKLQAEDVVSIRRTTPIKDKLVNFTDLNILNGETQNLAQEQVFNAVQEMYDKNEQQTQNFQKDINDYKEEIEDKIQEVKDATGIINTFKEGVKTCVKKAEEASNSADVATAKAEEASQTLSTKEDKTNKGQANGYAALGADGKVPAAQLPNTGWRPSLLQPFWSEYELDRMDMLRADTFSWQNGTAYSAVYNLLFGEYNNSASTEQTENGITFKVTPRGFRIADSTQEQAILNLYNTTGVAGYFIIDLTNTRFKLPRTKYGFVGLRDIVGSYVPESLPNITGTVGGTYDGITSGAFKPGKVQYPSIGLGKGGSNTHVAIFNASQSSSAYQDNAPVQQRATQMYLYFYVGEYVQTAVEQTAGLNAELFNNKLDTDHSNDTKPYIKEAYRTPDGSGGYNLYSNGYCEQWSEYTKSTMSISTENVYLFKPYAGVNGYVVTVTCLRVPTAANANALEIIDRQPAYFSVGMTQSYWQSCVWRASGYLAQGQY
nr:MAG TPA: tail fiber protein [Caudoviricetes sp.]